MKNRVVVYNRSDGACEDDTQNMYGMLPLLC